MAAQVRNGRDLTKGSIPRHLFAIAMPMLAGNALNAGYSIVDTIWLGKIAGDNAVAATAVSFPVVFIFIAVAAGATMATSILIAQYYGAKDDASVERVVGTSFSMALILGVLLGGSGVVFGDAILRLLNTPQIVFDSASLYLKISFAGFTFQYMGFLIASILRGTGDTKTPLIFMTAGVIINALLDPLLIAGPWIFPRWGVAGAAVASVISSAAAFLFAIRYLNRKNSIVAFRLSRLVLERECVIQIFKIGFPSMVQHSFISIGMAAMAFLVNRFGAGAMAAYGAAGRIDSVAFMPAMSIGMAVSTLAGQNLGAKDIFRVRLSFRWGIVFTTVITGVLALIFVIFPSQLMSIFVNEQSVIDAGTSYLRIIGPSLLFFSVYFVTAGIINGAGHTMITMVFSIVILWGVRVPCGWFLSQTALGLTGVWIAFAISFAAAMIMSSLYYRSGLWQKPVIRKSMGGKQPLPAVIAVPDAEIP
jgi:putative MATE family efflux protein